MAIFQTGIFALYFKTNITKRGYIEEVDIKMKPQSIIWQIRLSIRPLVQCLKEGLCGIIE